MAKSYAILGAEIPKAAAGKKDRRVAMALERAGGDAAINAVAILLGDYCAKQPGLLCLQHVRQLRLRLFGTLDRAVWQQRLLTALSDEKAIKVAGRLDRHRTLRHMKAGVFLEILLTHTS